MEALRNIEADSELGKAYAIVDRFKELQMHVASLSMFARCLLAVKESATTATITITNERESAGIALSAFSHEELEVLLMIIVTRREVFCAEIDSLITKALHE